MVVEHPFKAALALHGPIVFVIAGRHYCCTLCDLANFRTLRKSNIVMSIDRVLA
jgi:hypothetical protein